MEEPVEKVSDRVYKLKLVRTPVTDFFTNTCHGCIIRILEFDKEFENKVVIRNSIQGIAIWLCRSPLSQECHITINWESCSCRCSSSEWRNIRMLDIKFKTFGITCKHVVISHQVVTKRNRLCMLQNAGVAWHNCVGMFIC